MKKSRVTLLLASSSLEAFWPWLEQVSPQAWRSELPALVLVPTRGQANALKAESLTRGFSHLGLRFITPFGLRELLKNQNAPAPEHLRLLLALAASDTPDDLAAKAVARSPGSLLRALDRFEIAGWDFEQLALPSFQPLVRRFRQLLRQCGLMLPAETERRQWQEAAKGEQKFSNIFITGFDGAHWSEWFLLRTAVALAHEATVVLDLPSENFSRADELWIGSWEEAFGEAQPLAVAARPGDALFTEAEMRGEQKRISFLVGLDASEQARAIARLTLRFLAQAEKARVGIVFSQPTALSRLVSAELTRLGLPHNDGLAHPVPGIFESAKWRAWLALQASPRIATLLAFLDAPELEDALRYAHSQVLIDDLSLLAEFCADKNPEVAAALRAVDQLPDRATLREFLQRTEAACTQFGWREHWIAIAQQTGAWIDQIEAEVSRDLYLRWLGEMANSFATERSPDGNHPYATVQLLTVPQACGQEWSHLIFAGWNEGAWPRPAAGEFARENEIAAFNENIATARGRQGEGHLRVREGHTFYLGPAEQRAIALRQFETLRRSATDEVALTASLVQESEPERLWNPSELFTQIYLDATQRPLTQNAMRELQAATRAWLEQSAEKKSPAKEIQQTRVAYDQRRDPEKKSGSYDFAFPEKPNRAAIFSVSEFDRFVSAPALVWMKHYLGVEAVEDDAHIWASSSGRWIHDWLKQLASGAEKTFSRLPKASEIDQRIVAAANTKRAQIEALCLKADKPLPDWWLSGWRNALYLARVLGERLSTSEDWPWMATEWKLEHDPAARPLAFRGRIDLILAREEISPGSLKAAELWIIDYKTGNKAALKLPLKKKLLDGTALQLSLYAQAVCARGADSAHMSILSPAVRPLSQQLRAVDLKSEEAIFENLAAMQRTGIFGMHGPLRGAFRFVADYPMATLGIDQDTLEQRWELTHPALVRDDEEMFW